MKFILSAKTKFRVLIVLVLFLTVALVCVVYQNYRTTRAYIIQDLTRLEYQFWSFNNELADIAWKGIETANRLERINDFSTIITRNMNIIEKNALRKHHLELYLEPELDLAMKILHQRMVNNRATQRENRLLANLGDLFYDSQEIIKELRRAKTATTLLWPANLVNLAENMEEINRISRFYSRYNLLPDEISPIFLDELEILIRDIWGQADLVVDFPGQYNRNIEKGYAYIFEIRDEGHRIIGQVDAYTGQIMSLGAELTNQGDDELLPPEQAQNHLEGLLQRLYGHEYNFEIEYHGLFEQEEGGIVHDFTAEPFLAGYPVKNGRMTVGYDARTGKLTSLTTTGELALPNNPVPVDAVIDPQGVDSFSDQVYDKTQVMRCVLTGRWLLAHCYNTDTKPICIDATTGHIVMPLETIWEEK